MSTEPIETSEPVETTPRGSAPAPRRPYRRPRFALWIGLGALLGLAFGLAVAWLTDGPATVSRQTSLGWMGIFFLGVGTLLGALASVIAEKVLNRGR